MKTKLFVLSLLMLCVSVSISAQSFNAMQENLRSEIRDFLYKEGLNPVKTSDGLKFKSEGRNYFIEIDEKEKRPMYLKFCQYVKLDDSVKREKVMKNLNDYNGKYVVKVNCYDEYVLISSEMFVTKASEFTDIFYVLFDLEKDVFNIVKE